MERELISSILNHPGEAERMAEALKTLGNPTRLRIMALLACTGERSVKEIGQALGLPQAVVSQQLATLRLHGQVKVRPDGGYRHYSVAVSQVGELLACLVRCCETSRPVNRM